MFACDHGSAWQIVSSYLQASAAWYRQDRPTDDKLLFSALT